MLKYLDKLGFLKPNINSKFFFWLLQINLKLSNYGSYWIYFEYPKNFKNVIKFNIIKLIKIMNDFN